MTVARVQIGMRVRLVRGQLRDMRRTERDNFISWCGGDVYVGETGILALYTKSPNELLSEQVRQYKQPDRVCVLWDRYGVKPVPYKQPGSGRECEGTNYQFCISANVGDPLPDYLEVVDDAATPECNSQAVVPVQVQ